MKENIKKIFLYVFLILLISVIFSLLFSLLKGVLGFSQEKFNEIVMAGFFQSILSGTVLYFIFNEFLVKRPKLRLYIEPNKINEKEFILDFYIKNIGNFSAKDTIITISFPDLIIIEQFKGGERIDSLRGNTPTIQMSSKSIHPRGGSNQQIAKIKFRFSKIKKEIEIRYDVEAENMDYFEGIYKIAVDIKI
jgi:hypothetical protein